ncbi:MAG: hypothetical protein FJ308_19610 [Planctomycetes bacterium]|nr:hypothetical protein [Planctomycetota bacterium]
MKSPSTEWILVVAMLIISGSSGCRNTLPNDRPSRLWEVATLQQTAIRPQPATGQIPNSSYAAPAIQR